MSLSKTDITQISELITVAFDKQNAYIHERFDQIDTRLDGMDAKLLRLDQRMDSLEQRMNSLEQRMDSLDQRMDSLEQRMDSLEQRMSDLEKKVELLEARVVALEEEMQAVKQSINELHLLTEQIQAATLENLSQIQIYGDRLEVHTLKIEANSSRLAVIEKLSDYNREKNYT